MTQTPSRRMTSIRLLQWYFGLARLAGLTPESKAVRAESDRRVATIEPNGSAVHVDTGMAEFHKYKRIVDAGSWQRLTFDTLVSPPFAPASAIPMKCDATWRWRLQHYSDRLSALSGSFGDQVNVRVGPYLKTLSENTDRESTSPKKAAAQAKRERKAAKRLRERS